MGIFPRITFGIIVLNGEPFTRYCLRALYPYAHQIVVVEGAVKGAASIATPAGHSRDGTLEELWRFKREEDPQDKLVIVVNEGFWPEKDEMCRAYLTHASGDYLWHVDIDEFYLPRDMDFILSMLRDEPDIGQVSFMHYAFWGRPEIQAVSTYIMRPQGGEFPRLFRIGPGYGIPTHRPMTVYDDNGIDVRLTKWIRGQQLQTLGIMLYHYTLLFPQQVRDKIAYYSTWALERCSQLQDWMNRNYFGLENPFNLYTVNDHPGWLEPYEGVHPPQIEAMMTDITAGRLDVELHHLHRVRALIRDPQYRRKITRLKDYAMARPEEPLTLDTPFVRKEILEKDAGLRVLFLNQLDSRGGAAQVAYGLASRLHEGDARPTFVAGTKKRSDYWVMESPGRELDAVLQEKAAAAGFPDYGVISSYLLLNRLELLQADVVNLHNQHLGYLNPLCIPLLGRAKPLVWTLHDMQAFTGNCAHSLGCNRFTHGCGQCPDISSYPGLRLDTTDELWLDKSDAATLFSAHLVTPSAWMRSKIEQSFLGSFPLTVIPNGVDTGVFRPIPKHTARQRLGLPQDRLILAFTADGGLSNPWKGGQYLLDALRYLAGRHPNILLLNIGGNYTDRSLPMISIPYVFDPADLAVIYAAADLFAYPTLADSFGLVVLEALACGLPVVAFATGGVPEIIRDGENGLLTPPGDQDRFNTALDMLLRKEVLRQAMARAAASIPECFTLQAMVNAYMGVYEKARETFLAQGSPPLDKEVVSRLLRRLANVGNHVGVKAYRRLLHGKISNRTIAPF